MKLSFFPSVFLWMNVIGLAATIPAKKAVQPDFQPNPRNLNPAPGLVIPVELREELSRKVWVLGKTIEDLRRSLQSKPALKALLPDVEIYYNAVRYALEDDIFTGTNQFNSARILLQTGLDRAKQLTAGEARWNTKSGLLNIKNEIEAQAKISTQLTHVPLVRGYRSKIDGSVQPYGVKVPVTYLTGDDQPRRLDLWLHGRSDTLNEIAFLEGQQRGGSPFLPADTFVLEPYGRFMNAFKFAGETDVFESLDSVARVYPIDGNKLALRGFSMGGAGAWHLGAHYSDKWAVINPGAGFVDVKNYQKLGKRLGDFPWWEQRLWGFYDALVCPINFANSTLVAYSGEIDTQKAAADLMEAALLKEGVKMTHIIGAKTGHSYEKEAKKQVEKRVDEATHQGLKTEPTQVSLVTHSLKFNSAHGVTIEAMEHQWQEARVDSEVIQEKDTVRLEVKTGNVTHLSLKLVPASRVGKGARLVVDGQDLGFHPTVFAPSLDGHRNSTWSYEVKKTNGRWSKKSPEQNRKALLLKRHNLQGPIDDAFMDSFVMVQPTGQPLNAAVGAWVETERAEAIFHWRRYFRGEPRLKRDSDISAADLQDHHLILWGDPRSNRILARIAHQLPIQWNSKSIRVGNKTYDPTQQVPVFIFPNPLNPKRYVVINSGFTFPQFAAESNSLQTPKLPDWAILDLRVPLSERIGGKGVIAAQFFGESWELIKTTE